MDNPILKVQTEKLPIGTSGDINKLPSNSLLGFSRVILNNSLQLSRV